MLSMFSMNEILCNNKLHLYKYSFHTAIDLWISESVTLYNLQQVQRSFFPQWPLVFNECSKHYDLCSAGKQCTYTDASLYRSVARIGMRDFTIDDVTYAFKEQSFELLNFYYLFG